MKHAKDNMLAAVFWGIFTMKLLEQKQTYHCLYKWQVVAPMKLEYVSICKDSNKTRTSNTVDGRNPAPPGMYKTL